MKKVVLAIWNWLGFFTTRLRLAASAFRRGPSTPGTSGRFQAAWRLAAARYRRWFRAELAGNLFNKRRGDQATYKLHLTGRCAFCGQPFDELETIVWIPGWHRGYCLGCRDEIDAAERAEAEAEAKVDVYARHGVARKDFY